MSVNADARQYVGEEESTHNEATTSSDVNVDLESIAAAASANEPKTAEDEKIESMALNYAEGSREYNIAQFVMAMMSGMLGGQSIIFAKTVVELLKATFFGPEGDTYNAFGTYNEHKCVGWCDGLLFLKHRCRRNWVLIFCLICLLCSSILAFLFVFMCIDWCINDTNASAQCSHA